VTDKAAYEEGGSLIYPELYTQSQIETAMGNALPSGFTADFTNNHYVLWRTEIQGVADQPWNLTIKDTPDAGGTVIGQFVKETASISGSRQYSTPGDTITITDQALYGLGQLFPANDSGKIYVYSLVAYPIDPATGKAGVNHDNQVNNSISVTMTGVDDNIARTKSDSAPWNWEPYDWIYAGDIIGVRKYYDGSKLETTEPSWLAVYKKDQAAGKDTALPHDWLVDGTMRGYDLIYVPVSGGNGARVDHSADYTYTLDTVDDIQYIKSNAHNYVEMDYQDYYYTSVNVKVTDYGIDVYEDRETVQTEGLDTSIWVMTAEPGKTDTWQHVADVPYAQLYQKGYDLPQEWIDKGVYRVKAEHSANDYATHCYITGNTALRKDSPKAAQLLADPNATQLTVQNLGGVYGTATAETGYIQDTSTDQYDAYSGLGLEAETTHLYNTILMRDNASVNVTDINGENRIVKYGTARNNPLLGRVDLTYQIAAGDGYLVYSMDGVNFLEDNGITADRNTVTIYDLLPQGISFDPSKTVTAGRVGSSGMSGIAGGTSNIKSWLTDDVSVSTSVTADYKGSGRQLVAFTITYSGASSAIYSTIDKSWASSWAVNFGAYYQWSDYPSCNNAQNTAAFQTPDAMKGTASADNGSGAPSSTDIPGTDTSYISDLDGDNDTTEKNVIYATYAVQLDAAMAAKTGIEKYVKEDANTYGVPEIDASGVERGKTYTYTVSLSTANNTAKNIVIFDRLENSLASRAENDTHSFESNCWYGTFVSTNVDALKALGIDVKVYYATNRDIAYPDAAYDSDPTTISNYLTTAGSGWTLSTDYTGDKADIKAVAYDLTTKTGGGPYTMLENSNISFTITMRAPADMQDNASGNSSAKDPNSPATYAYNNPAFFATSQENSGAANSGTTIGNSTSIKLYKPAQLSVEKVDVLGTDTTTGTFSFTVTVDGKLYANRQYKLYEKDADNVYQLVSDGQIRATDGSGILKLKKGQKAEFDDLPSGVSYKVTENTGLHWTKESSAAEGTLSYTAASAAQFTNTYHPLTYFEKNVLYATSSTNADDTFTFEMYLNGEPAKEHTYYIVDPAASMDKEPTILSTQTTDANGRFTLKAGQRICVVQNSGDTYKFTETGMSAAADYTPVKDTVSGTATEPYASAVIKNSYNWKDIDLTKTVRDLDGKTLTSNETFAFHIYVDQNADGTAADSEPWANKNYVLLDASGNQTGTGTTNDTGGFSLTAGQTIKLTHIAGNTAYRFTEALTAAQQQRYKGSGEISGKTPAYAAGNSEFYTNTDQTAALEVKKTVICPSSEMDAAAQHPFTFTLYVDSTGDNVASDLEPYAGKTYTLKNADGTTSSGTTSSTGTFTLKHGQTAHFDDVKIGTAYRVVEAADPDYIQVPDNTTGTITDKSAVTTASYVNNRDTLPNTLSITKNVKPGEGITADVWQAILDYHGNYGTKGKVSSSSDSIADEYLNGAYPSALTSLFRAEVDKHDGNGYVPYTGSYVVPNRMYAGGTKYYTHTWYISSGDKLSYTGFYNAGNVPGIIPLYPGETATLLNLNAGWDYRVTEYTNVHNLHGNTLSYNDPVSGALKQVSVSWALENPVSETTTGTLSGRANASYTNIVSEGSKNIQTAYKHILFYYTQNSVPKQGALGNKVAYEINSSTGISTSTDAYTFAAQTAALATVDKNITFQLLQNNGSGGWAPAVGVPWYDMSTSANRYNIAGYSDANGYIVTKSVKYVTSTTSTTEAGYVVMPQIGIETNDPLNGITSDGNQSQYKLVEIAGQTDPAYGTFIGYEYGDIGNSLLPPKRASFTVAKQVSGDSAPETVFSFTLSKYDWVASHPVISSKTIAAGQAYTLWNDNGTPDDTSDDTQITDGGPYQTDDSGVFTLKAGQYAKFENMDPTGSGFNYTDTDRGGTIYRVDETPANGYTTAVTADGIFFNDSVWPTDTLYQQLQMTERTGWIWGGTTNGLTYTNTYHNSPDLKISKSVLSGDAYTTPFTFKLTVDDAPYANEEYRLYSAEDNTEVFNDQTINGVSVRLPWTTDEYGEFTLTGSQYAVFEYLGTGKKYDIKEMPLSGWQQVEPAAGTDIQGIMPSTGASEKFVNTYGNKADSITVRKAVSWPSGLAMPDDASYLFHISVAGTDYAMKDFTVYDSKGMVVSTIGHTNSLGVFSLKAGQYAVFSDVPADVDYEVHEVLQKADGSYVDVTAADAPAHDFWLASSSDTAGATSSSGVTAAFTNAQAAFLVGKNVSSTTGDTPPENDAFTFTLTLNGSPAPDQSYWLYDADGNQTGTGTTDANGQFTITSKQRALFYGIPAGTEYNVKETYKLGYTQTTPADPLGYTGTVTDTVPKLTFENDYSKNRVLAVTKHVTGDSAPTDAKFTFLLEIGTADAQGNITYAPCVNRLYTVGSHTFRTTSEGRLTLTAEQTALFSSLPANARYRVTELNLPAGFTNESDVPAEGVVPADGAATTVTNHYNKFISILMPATGGTFLWWSILLGYAGVAFIILLLLYEKKLKPKKASSRQRDERH